MNKRKNGAAKLVKRTVKATVFADLFSVPKYRKQLYLTFHPEDKDIDENEIREITLKRVVTNGEANDFALLVRDTLIQMHEAQSHWNPNITLRFLGYSHLIIDQYLYDTGQYKVRNTKVKIPKLELFVIYTGNQKLDKEVVSFNEEYFDNDESCPIDIKVRVITITNNKNVVMQYIRFCKIFDNNYKKFGYDKKCIVATLDECTKKGILKEYLQERRKELTVSMVFAFDQEEAEKLMKEEAYDRGIEQGMQQGMQQGAMDILVKMVTQGIMTVKEAAKMINISEKEFKDKVNLY